jgi:hypothetical protein
MSAGRKENPEKSVSPGQPGKIPDQPAATVDNEAASHPGSPAKPGKPEHRVEFAQGTYYRQGVRVPDGQHKNPMPRTRNR